MQEKYKRLFEPIKIGNLEVPNRYFMAPMGIPGMADVQGAFNQKAIDYYVERAKGQTGLIITGITKVEVEVEAFGTPGITVVGLNNAAFVQTAKQLTERVQAYGSKIFLQLGAGFGRAMVPVAIAGGAGKVAPSEVENRWNEKIIHRALTTEEVEQIVQKMAEGAYVAKLSGFDGVEVHAVHEGYLLDQFTMSLFNKRTDKYGGSFENRYRFAVEVVQAIKKLCGEDFPVSLRYSIKSFIKDVRQGGLPGEEFEELGRDTDEGVKAAKYLVDAGYDALDVDAGCYDSWYWNHPPMYFDEGMYLPFAKEVKKVVDVPVMVAGRMDNPDLAIKAMEENEADMIGLGRPLLADALIPKKIQLDQIDRIRPCLSCQDGCLGRLKQGLPISCAVNPQCGKEAIYTIQKADTKKSILVVGGGVAGMEYARVSALRGYQVSLYEKTNALGGALIPGGMPPFKRYDHKLVDWYKNELELLNVKIHLNTEVTKDKVESEQFDKVVVATGSKAIELPFKGKEKNRVFGAIDVLMDIEKAKDNIAIIGAGLVGAELGLWLAQLGKKVTIVEMSNQILGGDALCFANSDMLKDLLNFNNVTILKNTTAKEVTEKGLIVSNKDGDIELEADTIVEAVGYRASKELYEQVKFMSKDVQLLGDAQKVDNILNAIWDAHEVARES